ncbi:hypothetical protein ACVIHI_008740 [Bradyrhizobium sp. USDA 4524]|uniref:hypothetical protein n=1 Tax=unclassified Bradyrhizobium TaxID=2631580 RepID=UPI00209EB8CB|nr:MULTISPECIES: hypothetical protein [unclassified Bradyrhizobium]MCP1845796.1 hypothetical protein [Bradyrhizobium sp. USDA 4538]MCP1906881.1 hypothetical protein [Bradyrhizobium sp. USDA 4537]MCP1985356.1 hypothetical protein [Bradyrhizobium sp. USDA 4539]
MEIINITDKYHPSYIWESFRSLKAMHAFSIQFVKNVADLYDGLTRRRNIDRNSSGFSLDDAPILGLLMPDTRLFQAFDNLQVVNTAAKAR